MKKTMLRYISLALLIGALTVLLCCCSSAGYGTADLDEYGYMLWTVSEDGTTLDNGSKTYHACNLGLTIDPTVAYRCYNPVSLPFDGYQAGDLCLPYPDAEYLWVLNDTHETARVYATEQGREELKALVAGASSQFSLLDQDGKIAYLVENVAHKIEQSSEGWRKIDRNARTLSWYPCYELVAFDAQRSFRYAYGAVFSIDGGWYYLPYEGLSNEHFGEYRKFLYADEMVSLFPLEEDVVREVKQAVTQLRYERTVYIEEVNWNDEPTYQVMVAFWIFYVLIGFLLPVPFLVLGLLLPISQKLGNPRYWYVLAILAALWILLAVMLMLLLIL